MTAVYDDGPGLEPLDADPEPFDYDRYLLKRMPEDLRSVIRRCAVVAYFDEELYGRLVSDDPHRRYFNLLRDRGLIESAGARQHRIRDGLRSAVWRDGGVAEHARLAPRLLSYFTEEHPEPLRELSQLAVLRPIEAKKLFLRLFNDAAADYDPAACADILKRLLPGEGVGDLGELHSSLVRVFQEYTRLLDARLVWDLEYRKTQRYVAREGVEDRLIRFLDSEDEQVLWLCARGGIGKSMQLNWLLARYCAGRESQEGWGRPIPAARIDLFEINPIVLSHPWLLLVEAAAQLNRQMDDSPFDGFLGNYESYEQALRPPGRDGRHHWAGFAALFGQLSGVDETRMVERARVFGRLLAEGPDRRVLVVLDTVEDAWAGKVEARRRIGMMIQAVCEEAESRVKFVLAGRLSEESAPAGLPGLVGYELSPFTEQDCRRYLVEVRGLSAGDDVTEAIASRCKVDGIPLVLALFADIAEEPGVTAERILTDSRPALYYALNRNVCSLPEALRVPALFGAMTRSLTSDLFSLVVEHLHDHRLPRELLKDLEVSADSVPEIVPEEAFRELREHADKYNWIGTTKDGKAVRARQELRGPLREALLRRCPGNLAAFHDRVAMYYGGRAHAVRSDEPERWAWLRIEEIYHRLRQGQAVKQDAAADPGAADRALAAAVGTWRDAVAEARGADRHDLVAMIAQSVFAAEFKSQKSDLIGGGGVAIEADLGPDPDVMPHHLWYEAYLTLAGRFAATAESSHRTRWDEEWRQAREYLDLADAMRASDDAGSWEVTAEAQALREELGLRYQVALRTNRRAEVSEALGQIASAPDESAPALPARDRIDQAVRIAESGSARAEVLLAACRPAEAAEALPPPRESSSLHELSLLGRTQLGLLRPAVLVETFTEHRPSAGADVSAGWELDCELLLALGFGRLLDLRAAERAYRRCLGLTGEPPLAVTPAETSEVGVQQSRTYLEQVGDLKRAFEAIRRAWKYLPAEPPTATASWGSGALAPIHVEKWGDTDEPAMVRHQRAAIYLVRALIGATDPSPRAADGALTLIGRAQRYLLDASPACRAEPHLVALSVGGVGDADRLAHLEWLNAWLAKVPSVGARLTVLERLGNVAAFPAGSRRTPRWSAAIETFAALVPDAPSEPPRDRAAVADRAVQGLVRGDVARVLGRHEDARSWYRDSCRVLGADDPFAWWHLYNNHPYSRIAAPDEAVARFRAVYGTRQPFLVFAFLTETAARRQRQNGEVRDLLAAARELQEAANEAPLSRWHARYAKVRDLRERERQTNAALGHAIPAALAGPIIAAPTEVVLRIGDSSDDKIIVMTSIGVRRTVEGGRTVQDSGKMVVDFRLPASIRGAETSGYFVLELDRATENPSAVDSLKDWSDIREFDDLRDAFHEVFEAFEETGRKQWDIRIEIADPRLARVPWEVVQVWEDSEKSEKVALPRHPRVRHVYRAVADSAVDADLLAAGGADTADEIAAAQRLLSVIGAYQGPIDGVPTEGLRSAVRGFQTRHRLTSGPIDAPTWAALRARAATSKSARFPRVVLLGLDHGGQSSAGRRAGGYRATRSRYAKIAGIALWPAAVSSADEVAQAVSGLRPDIVHLIGEMTGRRDDPALSFGPSGPPLFASRLSAIIRDLDVQPPLVVLDVVRPPRRIAAIEQLVLRNEFAHQLLALGRVQAVLAAGLRPRAGGVDDNLSEVAQGRSVADVRTRIHRAARNEDLASSSVALFASVPPDALIPAGLWPAPSADAPSADAAWWQA